MAKIISLEEKRLLKALQDDVNSYAAEILDITAHLSENKGGIRSYASLDDWLAKVISAEILRRKQLSEEIVLCGIYIAALLATVDRDLGKYGIDFLDKWSSSSDPNFLKMGGDFCFILCGAFTARCERRMMRLKDYQQLGESFYEWFYSSTGKVIGHYMSSNFRLMQEIVTTVLPATSARRTLHD